MSSSEILLTIRNNTDKVVATNVFNVDGYDWAEDRRPNTNIHERVIGPQSEIAELSRMNTPATSSYHLGLTFSDGRYLELTVDHGTAGRDGEVSPPAAEEMCKVSGSVDACRVERVLTGADPRTLHVSVFDKE